ncbi:MAG: glutamyl-tRNA reductase [Terriglobales bacterium]
MGNERGAMGPVQQLHLLGVSYRTAPVAVREGLSFQPAEAAALLHDAAAVTGCEAAVLSTCNRTEFYLAAPGDAAVEHWLAYLPRLRPHAPILRSECHRYQLTDKEALRHLVRVACGLDSAVLGDRQILSQVKEAAGIAAEAGTMGAYLNQAFAQAIRAGKQARAETGISHGAASLGSALAELVANHVVGHAREQVPRILVIGAGQIARDIGWNLAKRRLGELKFLNRSTEKATALAEHCGGQALAWSQLDEGLDAADVIVAATSAKEPILRRARLDALLERRPACPPLVVDAGVPRNTEAGSALGVVDIDAIREQRQRVLTVRRAAVPSVDAMVECEVASWVQWCEARPVEDAIGSLYRQAVVFGHEASRQLFASGTPSPKQAEEVFLRTFRRVLHGPVRRLRAQQMPRRPDAVLPAEASCAAP